MIKKFTLLFFILLPYFVFSQAPADYYNSAQGKTGSELKTALYNIIKGHKEFSYGALWDILSNTDQDSANTSDVILIYTGLSRAKTKHGGNLGDWNREHVWAKSHGGFGNNPPCGTDAHHIRPADVKVNSLRGNLDFDNGGSLVAGTTGCYRTSSSFEPRDAVKGDVARMIFYMATRYEGFNGEPDLEVVNRVNTSPAPEMGKLSTLLQWNKQDPPDNFEKRRNNVIFKDYQHNRNPYIDHPEYIEKIWGSPTAVNNIPELSLEVYPNPVVDKLNIIYSGNLSLEYKVYNLTGNLIKTGNLNNVKTQIDLSGLPNGLFLIRISALSTNWNKTYRIVKLDKK